MKKYYLLYIVTTLLFSTSCTNWLDVKPIDRQTANEVFNKKEGFWSSVNGVYASLGASALYGRNLTYEMIDIMGRRYNVPVSTTKYTNLVNYVYTEPVVAATIEQLWRKAYSTILTCNVILENAEQKREMLGEKDYNIIKGEMLAVRAFIHFDLLRLFGPIYPTSSELPSVSYNNSAIANMYEILPAKTLLEDFLLKDIEQAETLLFNSDPIISDGPLSSKTKDEIDKGISNTYRYRQLRFNYYALMALKARVYLYKGDALSALETANILLNDTKVQSYFPTAKLSDISENNSNPDRMYACETLFGIYDNARNNIFKDCFNPETTSTYLLQSRSNYISSTSSSSLFNGMANDYRKLYQWGTPGISTNQDPMLIKYKDISDKDLFHASFIPLIRIAEVRLIAIEAEAIVNNTHTNALIKLNEFRVSRNGGTVAVSTLSALHTQIMNEYAREFYGEGQLFYYFKRRNVNMPSSCNGFSAATIAFTNRPDRLVVPLPKSEITPR